MKVAFSLILLLSYFHSNHETCVADHLFIFFTYNIEPLQGGLIIFGSLIGMLTYNLQKPTTTGDYATVCKLCIFLKTLAHTQLDTATYPNDLLKYSTFIFVRMYVLKIDTYIPLISRIGTYMNM
jgi:hypothetical protein